ncbi:alpha-glucosidase [Cellulomonas sp.]|uniref:glycoside hydrolase family 13 protein n=1 Tax=Cellulomonas sp. TaxID=40001 RepID=UPI001B11F22B|nr:alpha-glucosidase [Cellulomonas sp.]MBO9553853.1 alpha-glucosidase [Cellulomonas sp.]
MSWTVDDAPWWTKAVVYQIYPRSFADSDGDGIGDIPGILQHLDHLVELGVDVVWLSPVYSSPQDDNGYDISDYQDVDPVFGTLDDLDELIGALHAHGIRLVMDLVVNHTSDEHPWFVDSRSGKDSEKRDWYWWRPARPGTEPGQPGAEPTNWGSFFSGPVWELDEETQEYYLHLFSRKQPDLNWENPQVRHAVYDMMRWWLARGVDGFRMDVINLVSKEVPLRDGVVHGGLWADGSPFYTCGPRIHEFLAEMHREVFADHPEQLLAVGEMPGVTIEDARLFTDPARAEVDMVFQFEHVGLDHGPGGKFDTRPLRLTDLKTSFGRWQSGLADAGWNSLYWDNHDQPRIVSRFGDDGVYRRESATMLATVLHLHRGTPYVYQGEELGMTNAHFTRFEDYQDIESLRHISEARARGHSTDDELLEGLARMSRDNARTPVQWDASEHAGFTTGTPWLPVNANYPTVNAEAERADPRSVFHHYRRLVALRHEDPVVALGDFTMLLPDDEHVYAFTRRLGDESLLVLGNFTGDEQTVDVGDAWAFDEGSTLLLGNYDDAGAAGSLRPWEARVYRRSTT